MIEVRPRRINRQPHPRQARADARPRGGKGLVEMFESCAGGMRPRPRKCRFGNSDRDGSASDLKPWKNDFHHCLESFGFVCEAGVVVNVTVADRHRSARISTQADAIPCALRFKPGSILLDDI